VEKFEALVRGKEIRHDGNPALAQHMANAKRRMNRYGYSIRKESRDSSRKIDLAVCAIGASLARWDVRATGALGKRRSVGGNAYAF
jgi:phage terminase large subunit-like protein